MNALGLGIELRMIINVLPLTAATRAKIEAAGFGTQVATLENLLDVGLRVRLLLLEDPCADAVAWNGPGDEDDESVLAGERLSAVRELLDT